MYYVLGLYQVRSSQGAQTADDDNDSLKRRTHAVLRMIYSNFSSGLADEGI
jgi:hypothetical protein